MAQALQRAGADVRLLHAVRTGDPHLFAGELEDLLGSRFERFAGRRLDLAAEIARLHPDGELYLCGPPRMREAVQQAWQAAGRAPRRLRFETFATSGRFPTEPFVARVRDHGDREIAVPADRTLLAALQASGIDVMADCLRGECGLCAVTVVERSAELDHRDVFLDPGEQEGGTALCACVSRAVGGTMTIDTGFRAGR
jgi:ferredoxin